MLEKALQIFFFIMKNAIFSIALSLPLFCIAQIGEPRLIQNIDNFNNANTPCISAAQHQVLKTQIEHNVAVLEREKGIHLDKGNRAIPNFIWPLQLAPGRPNMPFYITGNFVDLNLTSPTITDYNCGTKSYDNHGGIDIGLVPFGWKRMEDNDVQIIAAASGILIAKRDGDYDKNCGASAQIGNHVIIQHADGSRAYYWHMKNGTVTTQPLGATITVGDYLGLVGSSGNSSGPHLHFEVHDASDNIVDPYNGTCNNIGSLWINQKPYYEPTLDFLSTHANQQGPIYTPCPGTENPNVKTSFNPGELVDFYSFYHEQQPNTSVQHKILRPNNSVYVQWTSNFTSYLQISVWAASWYVPSAGPIGTWKYEATYMGQTQTTNFGVGVVLPIELLSFAVFPKESSIDLIWKTATEQNVSYFEVERSENGTDFKAIGSVKAKGNSTEPIIYGFSDKNPLPFSYYRLRTIDNDGSKETSQLLSAKWDNKKTELKASPNPTSNTFTLMISGKKTYNGKSAKLKIINMAGQLMEEKDILLDSDVMSFDFGGGYPSGVYYINLSCDNVQQNVKLVKI